MILLNPGPVNLSDRVRQALLRPDLCHREAEFSALQQAIRAKLLAIYDLDPGRWAAVLLSGSGTAAIEAMLTTLVPPPMAKCLSSRMESMVNASPGSPRSTTLTINGWPILGERGSS
jgi:aspartate aminotransferase-like enzyme